MDYIILEKKIEEVLSKIYTFGRDDIDYHDAMYLSEEMEDLVPAVMKIECDLRQMLATQ